MIFHVYSDKNLFAVLNKIDLSGMSRNVCPQLPPANILSDGHSIFSSFCGFSSFGDSIGSGLSRIASMDQGAPNQKQGHQGEGNRRPGGIGHTLLGGEITPGNLAKLVIGFAGIFAGFFIGGLGVDWPTDSRLGAFRRVGGGFILLAGAFLAINSAYLAIGAGFFYWWDTLFDLVGRL